MRQEPLPAGVWPVMLTAFTPDGALDGPGIEALTAWYIESGAAGLFTVCLSGEMYALTDEERLALAERVVAAARGKVPVVATGTFGGELNGQAAFSRRMAETGVDAVVVIANQLVDEGASDAGWRESASRYLDLTPDLPLGLYECPSPYHRLLSPELVGWAAHSGRFLFHKDTSCRLGPIRAKIEAARGTPFRFLNAHTPTLLPSLQAGGAGYCGTAANVYPRLLAWLCTHYVAEPERAGRLQHLLGVMDRAVAFKYPTSAKDYLGRLGLPIATFCRARPTPLEEPDETVLAHLRALVAELEREYTDSVPV